MSRRQEVINVCLAQVLHRRGLVAAPEHILTAIPDRTHRMVDVMVDYNGLRTAEADLGGFAPQKSTPPAVRRVSV